MPLLRSFSPSPRRDPTGGAGLQADLLTLASARLPSALGGDGAHRAGHARRRAPGSDRRRRAASRDRRARCLPRCGSRRSSSACSARRKTSRRSPRSLAEHAECSAGARSGARLGARRLRWRATRCAPRCASARAAVPRCSRRTAMEARAARRHGARAAARACGARVRARHRHARDTEPRWSTRSTTRAAWCARTAGRGCRAAITARAARSLRRSPPRSPTGLAMPDAVRDAQEYTWQALAERLSSAAPASCIPDRFSGRARTAHETARPVRHHARHRRHRGARRQGARRRWKAASRCCNTGTRSSPKTSA